MVVLSSSFLKCIRICRCVKHTGMEASSCQLHISTDASEKGYGISIYLRFVGKNGSISFALIMEK